MQLLPYYVCTLAGSVNMNICMVYLSCFRLCTGLRWDGGLFDSDFTQIHVKEMSCRNTNDYQQTNYIPYDHGACICFPTVRILDIIQWQAVFIVIFGFLSESRGITDYMCTCVNIQKRQYFILLLLLFKRWVDAYVHDKVIISESVNLAVQVF